MVCLIVGELVFHARASNPTRGPFAARHPPSLVSSPVWLRLYFQNEAVKNGPKK